MFPYYDSGWAVEWESLLGEKLDFGQILCRFSNWESIYCIQSLRRIRKLGLILLVHSVVLLAICWSSSRPQWRHWWDFFLFPYNKFTLCEIIKPLMSSYKTHNYKRSEQFSTGSIWKHVLTHHSMHCWQRIEPSFHAFIFVSRTRILDLYPNRIPNNIIHFFESQ